ncbi:helix-turn-helix domain-containing protein [Geobacillus sp. TFV-3]|uniref:helix-turn-helix domain-containing protein n=1 Tax=Geobacillus sp. TFV-3 TaxID=1897059 RepID=UPI00135766D0
MHKAYSFRLYPTKEQEQHIRRTIGVRSAGGDRVVCFSVQPALLLLRTPKHRDERLVCPVVDVYDSAGAGDKRKSIRGRCAA